jgi:ATP-dependent Clp protease ATP-binding subunit ClpA
MRGVRDYFVNELRRPELLNRFGENVVVFNFIQPEVGRRILASMMQNVIARIQEEHGVTVDLDAALGERLAVLCTADLTNGGRGIGAKLEAVFVNPLARLLFDRMPPAGGRFTVTDIEERQGVYRLDGHC